MLENQKQKPEGLTPKNEADPLRDCSPYLFKDSPEKPSRPGMIKKEQIKKNISGRWYSSGTEGPAEKAKLCRHYFFPVRGSYLSRSNEGDKAGVRRPAGSFPPALLSPHPRRKEEESGEEGWFNTWKTNLALSIKLLIVEVFAAFYVRVP